MTLNWDEIHVQSREQLCEASGVRIDIAKEKWADIEPWLRKLLQDNRYGFSLS
jgi:hypothetical protein